MVMKRIFCYMALFAMCVVTLAQTELLTYNAYSPTQFNDFRWKYGQVGQAIRKGSADEALYWMKQFDPNTQLTGAKENKFIAYYRNLAYTYFSGKITWWGDCARTSNQRGMVRDALLPYIWASSIQVHNEDVFKPEYIIPQLLLHTVVKDRKKYGYDGVIFTSTRRNVKYDDGKMELYDNIAIPVMSNRYKSYCKILASYFTETEPVCLEHEFLKGNIGSGSLGDNKYENTIFYALEKILQKKEFKTIL